VFIVAGMVAVAGAAIAAYGATGLSTHRRRSAGLMLMGMGLLAVGIFNL
jgi:hypothetical protein